MDLWAAILDLVDLTAEPVATVLAAWAWPVAVLVVALVFYRPLSWLIRNVRNIKTGVAEIELLGLAKEKSSELDIDDTDPNRSSTDDGEVQDQANEMARPSENDRSPDDLSHDIHEYSYAEAELAKPGQHHRFVAPIGPERPSTARELRIPRHYAPEARVREADRYLRGELFRAWQQLQLSGSTVDEMLRSLTREGVIESEFRDAYRALRAYATALAAGGLYVLDEDADDFVGTATVLIDYLRGRVSLRLHHPAKPGAEGARAPAS